MQLEKLTVRVVDTQGFGAGDRVALTGVIDSTHGCYIELSGVSIEVTVPMISTGDGALLDGDGVTVVGVCDEHAWVHLGRGAPFTVLRDKLKRL